MYWQSEWWHMENSIIASLVINFILRKMSFFTVCSIACLVLSWLDFSSSRKALNCSPAPAEIVEIVFVAGVLGKAPGTTCETIDLDSLSSSQWIDCEFTVRLSMLARCGCNLLFLLCWLRIDADWFTRCFFLFGCVIVPANPSINECCSETMTSE